MNRKVFTNGSGLITLNDSDYLASGGEADVYRKGKLAYKLYHDPDRMISTGKIDALARIARANVITPRQVVYDHANRRTIGYTMTYLDRARPLVKLFSAAEKKQTGLSMKKLAALIEAMRQTILVIHRAGCLVVDMNEMNILVSHNHKIPHFIDTDSYATPGAPATAISRWR